MRRSLLPLFFAAFAFVACDGRSVVGGHIAGDAAPDITSDVTHDLGPPPDVADAMKDAPAPDAAEVFDVAPDGPFACADDAQCAMSPDGPVCDRATGRCVQCTPENDRCAQGLYCVAGANRCAPGCRDEASCRIPLEDGAVRVQHCDLMTHQCVECASDEHCPPGNLCVGNVCVVGCNDRRACPTGQTCCAGGCVDTQASTAHCGMCMQGCAVANAVPACMNGTCTVGSCMVPFADCDMTPTNGCETDTLTSDMHCGGCGMVCAARPNGTARCTAGRCEHACLPGFADCDGDVMNGCEVDTRGSLAHCGRCSNACALSNATAACREGRCEVAACAAGFGDCDGVASNGCEADTQTSVTHCGACGMACPTPPGAAPVCTAGRCAFTCTAGLADCDGDAMNGCEVDTRTATEHCGSCGRSCATANVASARCEASACRVVACAMGFGDCDMSAVTGCEVDTRASTAHCGGCGNACPARPNAQATCAGGTCGFRCNEGFADCDGDATNGCETDTRTTTEHCGRCGNRCMVAGGAAACRGGACVVASCGADFRDCDTAVGNGCEVDIRTSLTHCGGCGTTCPARPNAQATCAVGMCGFRCNEGFADCDMNATNGCETDTRTSTTHCGACGRGCSVANGSPACRAGTCAVGSCNAGFGDCDGVAANGCETDTRASTAHCGRCGASCPGGANASPTCAGSACQLTCNAGFGNCDGVAANGCETDTRTSTTHCGACGRGCSVANGSPACRMGACAVGTCNAGFGDCDGNAANGCETNLRTTPAHCGACNRRGTEACNGADDDCDGVVDEGFSGRGCVAITCTGSGVIHTIPDGCMDDGGRSAGGDSLQVYCVNGVARFCLSGESCPWRSGSNPGDTVTCSRGGLGSDYMASAGCSLYAGRRNYYCDPQSRIYFP